MISVFLLKHCMIAHNMCLGFWETWPLMSPGVGKKIAYNLAHFNCCITYGTHILTQCQGNHSNKLNSLMIISEKKKQAPDIPPSLSQCLKHERSGISGSKSPIIPKSLQAPNTTI